MIPNETIDRVLDKTDIVELVSRYVTLKKAGQNFKACCPFHEEKTPSFTVSPGKQIYHCFGCAAGGNAIGFLMKHERMDFIEALKTLADKAGVRLPVSGRAGGERSSLANSLYDVNNLAADFYQENLAKERSKEAYRYFIERGISGQMIKLFRLGFAEDSWQSLINHCRTKGVDPDIAEKAGLALQSTQVQNRYDRFRNRVIFPIFDIRNRVLGFGARAPDGSLPKYINSPETLIYNKGTHLYGFNFSRDYIRKQDYVIIVEGYFDLILPFQNEIRNIVATLGTALTLGQISALKRFTKNVIMVYDSDKAGEEATLRSLDLLIEEGMNVRIALLPGGADPDSFVRKAGKEGFAEVLKNSKDLFDYKLGTLTAKFKKDDPRGKARIAQGMLPTLARIKDAVLKSAYLKKISEQLSIDEESVREELRKLKIKGFAKADSPCAKAGSDKALSGNLAELALLAVSLEEAKYIGKIESELGFGALKNDSIACILRKISELHKSAQEISPSRLMNHFRDTGKEKLISEAANISPAMENKEKILEDCFRHIKKHALKETLGSMQFGIKSAENAADGATVKKLLAEYNELLKGTKS